VDLIAKLLPVVRKVADDLKGSPLADEAMTDVRTLEALAAQHESRLAAFVAAHTAGTEEKVAEWLTERLQRYLPQPATAAAQPSVAAEPPDPVAVFHDDRGWAILP